MSIRRPGPDTEKLPWWSRPLQIAIRVIAIIVVAVFVTLTVIQLLP
ncbi:hypothetical protein AB0L64_09560 [Kribbella sp. NPDC051936]|jgi:hypothetical protein